MSEYQICRVEELQEGQMKPFKVEDVPIVVALSQGQYYAFGGQCPHAGAPLDEGVLKEYTVICPWHHACFDIQSGTRMEPPALDDIPHYTVSVKDGFVTIDFPHQNITSPQGKANPASDSRTFVIVGGGAAGNAATEELRRAGFEGNIILISADSNVPPDRTKLSKGYLIGRAKRESIPLRSADWYAERDIELKLNTRVTRIEPATHTVHFNQNDSLHYDKLLLATGGVPRRLRDIPGADLANIFTLRHVEDTEHIIAATQGSKKAVVIGASFIGMEAASSLGGRGIEVTIVEVENVPFGRILGEDIGRMYQELHETNGVRFYLGDGVTGFGGADGKVNQVHLKSGQVLEADFVVVGIGVSPATDFLQDTGLALDEKDHSVLVNKQLQSTDPDIYAAGDIARWWEDDGSTTRIEHWRVAQQQGIIAARNMLGEKRDVGNIVPFFWTAQWKLTLDYVGHATAWDNIVYWGGSPAQKKFLAFYIKNLEVKAVVGCGYDRELDALEIILRDHITLTLDQLHDPDFDFVKYAQRSM